MIDQVESLDPFQTEISSGSSPRPRFGVREHELQSTVQIADGRWLRLQDDPLPTTFVTAKVEGSSEVAAHDLHEVAARTYRLTPALLVQERFQLLQQWEGTVIEADKDRFLARLRSLTGPPDEEEAEIRVEEVNPADRELIDKGNVFYWSIGIEIKPYGRQTHASEIRFQRLPKWTPQEIQGVITASDVLQSFLNLERGNESPEE